MCELNATCQIAIHIILKLSQQKNKLEQVRSKTYCGRGKPYSKILLQAKIGETTHCPLR